MRSPPIFFYTLAYICGTLVSDYLGMSSRVSIFLATTVLFMAIIFALKTGLRNRSRGYQERRGTGQLLTSHREVEESGSLIGGGHQWPQYLAWAGFFAAGLVLTAFLISSLELGLLPKLAQDTQAVRAEGVVLGQPKRKEGKTSLFLRVDRVGPVSENDVWRTREYTRVIIRDEALGGRAPEPGDRITAVGRLSSMDASDPSYRSYFYRHRVLTFMFVHPTELEIRKARWRLARIIQSWRDRLRKAAHLYLPADEAGLLLGVLVGDTTGITPEVDEDFKATGLSHLVAVSGQNVAFIVVSLLLLLRYSRAAPLWQFLVCSLGAVAYAFLTLNEPSVLRATIMALVGLGAWFLGREYNIVASIAAAALLLLLMNPFLIFNVSFQLSFLATLAIIWFGPRIKAMIGSGGAQLKNLISVSVAAQLGVAPLIVYYFDRVSLVALPANLMVTPLMGLLMILGMLGGALAFFSMSMAKPIFLLLHPILRYAIGASGLLADVPGASVSLPHAFSSLVVVVVIAAGGLCLFFWRYIACSRTVGSVSGDPKTRSLHQVSTFSVAVLVLVLAGSAFWSQAAKTLFFQEVQVVFFDVGQGDSTFIRTARGATVLIDGGRHPNRLRQKLRAKRVTRLDVLILTHPHADHVDGLVGVVERYQVRLVLDQGLPDESDGYRDFLDAVERRHLRYRRGRAGQVVLLGQLKLIVLNPPTSLIRGTGSDINNNALVIRAKYDDFSLLVGGDIEVEGEKSLLSRGTKLRSVVLLVPHHGSAGSAYFPFLEAVRPEIAVISVGKNNYGHPSGSVLTDLRKLGAPVFRTDVSGDIHLRTDGHVTRVYGNR